MTNAEIIAAVERWQAAGIVHPLTCGTASCRMDLQATERDGKVALTCPACDYVQDWIPECVLATRAEDLNPWWQA